MRSGTLRTLIRIERPIIGSDPYGDPQVRSWELVVQTYAAKKLGSGSEGEKYDQRISSYDVEWRFRYRGVFDPRWRLVEVGTQTIHDIIMAADPDGRRSDIICRTRIDAPQPATEAKP